MKPSISKPIKRHLPISILILLNLLIGIMVVRDYGESWDEAGIYAYAKESIRAYFNLLENGTLPHYLNVATNAVNYGPAYAMITTLLASGLHAIIPAWSLIDGWHFGEFIAFQISILSLYFLSRKWMGGWAAFGTVLIYSTQPVIWGHAFINPKDIPFLAFFLASVTAGIYMVDALPASLDQDARQLFEGGSGLRLRDEWEHLPSSIKKITIAYSVIYLVSFCFIATGTSSRLVKAVITYLYNVDKASMLGSWFSRLAQNAAHLPVGNYIHKAQASLLRWEVIYLIAGFVIGLLVFGWIFSRYSRKLVGPGGIPSRKSPLRLFINPMVLAAGCVLGFTTSIRVAGPYAGMIVLVYAFYKSWRKAILLLIPYTSIALLTSYLTWPYLWGDAVNRLIASVTLMSHYPWTGLSVLFQGRLFPPSNLPVYFLPYLMSIQLTEVVPILFLFGLVLSAWNLIKGRQVEPFSITILWFILPLVGIIVDKSTLYDNFRQELFLLPPVFITAGIALEVLFSKVRKGFFKVLILVGVILPGIYADIQLHPYQYIYYNSFVGGEAGAFGNFQFDYWATSYREAAQYINQVAPADATVVVSGSLPVFQDYARPDLNLLSLSDLKPDIHYDFIVLSGQGKNTAICRSISPAKTIAREGAVLTVIKAPPLSVAGCP
ncbi:MAG: hypothetical protein ABSF61_05585 [Anaerolineales bacterium]|jgi:hypothetical protein